MSRTEEGQSSNLSEKLEPSSFILHPSSFLFVGLDLAWSGKNNTAGAVASYDPATNTATLTDWRETLGSNDEIIEWLTDIYDLRFTIYDWATSHQSSATPSEPPSPDTQPPSPVPQFNTQNSKLKTYILAVDAPLVVPNVDGTRPCDRELSRMFSRYQAGTHPANRTNLGRYGQPVGDIRGETLVTLLEEKLGFTYSPYLEKEAEVRQVFECYPHPAMVALFGLATTLKYKRVLKSLQNDRHAEYAALQKHLGDLRQADPPLIIPPELLARDTRLLRGAALKHYEDLLDAIMCAYIALYYWKWGEEKSIVFGNLTEGAIVTPRLTTPS